MPITSRIPPAAHRTLPAALPAYSAAAAAAAVPHPKAVEPLKPAAIHASREAPNPDTADRVNKCLLACPLATSVCCCCFALGAKVALLSQPAAHQN